jgi:hypothetical protein
MPTLIATIASTMSASTHWPVASDAAAANSSSSMSGLRTWFHRAASRVSSRAVTSSFGPLLSSRRCASVRVRPSQLDA